MSRLLGVAVMLWSAAAAGGPGSGPSGRVVRVERSGAGRVAPRLCEIHGDGGNCVGDEPRSGQVVAVLDEHRAVAEVQITEVTSYSESCPMLWAVKIRPIRTASADTDGIGVIDPGLDAGRAHLVDRGHLPPSPGGSPDEEVWRAIDRDGDGAADIVVTRFSCDASSRPVASGGSICIDVWARTGARMARTSQLNFAQCNRRGPW